MRQPARQPAREHARKREETTTTDDPRPLGEILAGLGVDVAKLRGKGGKDG
jgi:hypothetical protein